MKETKPKPTGLIKRIPETSKVCIRCDTERLLRDFPKHPNGRDGHRRICKVCIKVQKREWYNRPGRAESSLAANRYRQYGVTAEDYKSMMEYQNDVCAICGKPCDQCKSLAVDHDHTTGDVRALLCHSCNIGLGFFKDSSTKLARAAGYLISAKRIRQRKSTRKQSSRT